MYESLSSLEAVTIRTCFLQKHALWTEARLDKRSNCPLTYNTPEDQLSEGAVKIISKRSGLACQTRTHQSATVSAQEWGQTGSKCLLLFDKHKILRARQMMFPTYWLSSFLNMEQEALWGAIFGNENLMCLGVLVDLQRSDLLIGADCIPFIVCSLSGLYVLLFAIMWLFFEHKIFCVV